MKNKVILIIAISCLITGCNQFDFNQLNKEGDCLVSFHLVGEISTLATPMTKGITNDIYLLQVYRDGAAFASGVFDDPSSMAVNLKKGNEKYRIIVCLLKNGKERLGSDYSVINNSLKVTNWKYWITYYSGNRESRTKDGGILSWFEGENENEYRYLALNTLYYNSIDIYQGYDDQTNTNLKNFKTNHSNTTLFQYIQYAKIGGEKYPQCDDWFYGEISNYSPSGNYESLQIGLKRVGFKLKYELLGVTDGEVTVKFYKEEIIWDQPQIVKTFVDNTINTSTYASDPLFYAFYNAQNAWQYADDYMENMTLAVSWKRGIGMTEDYGTKTIQIKRNCLNNIKIQMTSADQNVGMNLTVESESSIGADAVRILVE